MHEVVVMAVKKAPPQIKAISKKHRKVL